MDDSVTIPLSAFNELRASAAAVPELERRAMVAGLVKHSAARPVHAKRWTTGKARTVRKQKRKAAKGARKHNRGRG